MRLFTVCFFVIFSFLCFSTYAAIHLGYIYTPTPGKSIGVAKYSGIGTGEELKFSTNTMYEAAPNYVTKLLQCTPGGPTTNGHQTVHYLFIPTSITIGGKSIKVKVVTPPSRYIYEKTISDHFVYIYNDGWAYYPSRPGVLFDCQKVMPGTEIPGNGYELPRFTLSLDISSLESKNYTGQMIVKSAHTLHYSYDEQPPTVDSTIVFNNSAENIINYDITIQNKCNFSTNQILFDHGMVSKKIANHTVSKNFTISCVKASSVTALIDIKATNKPSKIYSDGAAVGLGNGWDSVLKIEGKTSQVGYDGSSSSTTLDILGSNTFTLTSRLENTGTGGVGTINGSAVMTIYFY